MHDFRDIRTTEESERSFYSSSPHQSISDKSLGPQHMPDGNGNAKSSMRLEKKGGTAIQMTDWQAIQEFALHGSEKAFRELVERYSGMVYAVCTRILNDSHLAEDAAQTVFLILAEKAGSLNSKVILSGWLYRTAVYVAQRHKCCLERQRWYEKAAVEAIFYDSSTEGNSTLEKLRLHLDEALLTLPKRLSNAIILYYLQDKTQKETAMILGCREEAVQMRIGRGLKKMQAYLTRRDVAVTSLVLVGYLSEQIVEAAPSALVASIQKIASSKAVAGVFKTVSLSPIQKVAQEMWMGKTQIVVITLVVLISLSEGIHLARHWLLQNDFPQRELTKTYEEKNVKVKSLHRPQRQNKTNSALDDFNLEMAIKEALAMKEGVERNERFQAIAESIEVDDLDLVLALAKKHNPRAVFLDDVNHFMRVVAGYWARLNPKATVSWAEQLPESITRIHIFCALAHEWAKGKPADALVWVMAQMEQMWQSKDRSGMLVKAMVSGWADVDPDAAWAWAGQLPEGINRQMAFRSLGEVIGNKESSLALLLDGHSLEGYPKEFINGWIGSWTEKDPNAVGEWILGQPADRISSDHIKAVAEKLSTNFSQLALVWAQRLPLLHRDEALRVIACEWVERDPQSATQVIEMVSESKRVDAAMWVVARWAQSNPSAAIAYATQILKGQISPDIKCGIAQAWSSFAPEDAWVWGEQLPVPGERLAVLKIVAEYWGSKAPLEVIRRADQLTADERNDILNEVAGGWAARNLQAVVEWAKGLPDGKTRNGVLMSIVRSISYHDPSEAMAVAELLPESEERSTALAELVRHSTKIAPFAVQKWLGTLPSGRSRDQAIHSWINHYKLSNHSSDPEALVRWADAIEDKDIRISAQQLLVQKGEKPLSNVVTLEKH